PGSSWPPHRPSFTQPGVVLRAEQPVDGVVDSAENVVDSAVDAVDRLLGAAGTRESHVRRARGADCWRRLASAGAGGSARATRAPNGVRPVRHAGASTPARNRVGGAGGLLARQRHAPPVEVSGADRG